MLDRIDALLFAGTGRLLPRPRLRLRLTSADGPYTEPVKRVALLGATGSIGRQAIEIVEAHPGLELCAAASGSTPLDGVDAPLKQVGGDLDRAARARASPTSSSTPSSASPASTRRSGRSSTASTSRSRTRRASSPAGELALAARERGGGRDPPGRQRALGALPVPRRRRAGAGRTLVLTGSRRAVPRPHARRARRRHARARRSRTRPGAWARRSRSTRRRSRTRGSR